MIPLKMFFKKHEIEFETEARAISWLKSLKATQIVRVGNSYFVDEKEMELLFQKYLSKQLALRNQRAEQARANFSKAKLTKIKPRQQKLND